MVFPSLCEHASSTFIFLSNSSDQICLASSELFRKYDGLQRALRKFSASPNHSFIKGKRTVASCQNLFSLKLIGLSVVLKLVELRFTFSAQLKSQTVIFL